jgi:hypothetical protein
MDITPGQPQVKLILRNIFTTVQCGVKHLKVLTDHSN